MNKKKTTRQISRLYHYKRKLKYELIRGGERVNLTSYRKHLRLKNTLSWVMWKNDGWLFVNPLGIRSERMPF